MARLTDLYISSDILDTGATYITGVTSTINSLSTDNEIATAKSIYDASISGITSTQTLEDTLILGNETNGNDIEVSTLDKITCVDDAYIEIQNSVEDWTTTMNYYSLDINWNAEGKRIYLSPDEGIYYYSGGGKYTRQSGAVYTYNDATYEQILSFNTGLTSNQTLYMPDATGTIALTSDIVQPDLATVLSSGNETEDNDIIMSDGDTYTKNRIYWNDDNYIESDATDNGTTDLYASGGIRVISTDDNDYIISIDPSAPGMGFYSGVDAFGLFVNRPTITDDRTIEYPDASGTIALTSDFDLESTLVNGNTTNGNDIDVSIGDRINLYSSDYDSYLSASELYIGGTTDPWSIKINPEEGIEYSSSSSRKLTILTTKTDYYNGTYHKYIEDGDLTATRTIEYPDASGTLALTSDVTTASVWEVGSGIKSVQTSGTGCVASNTYSSASGEDTEATGRASHSEGEETLASGRGSHAEGRNTTASNSYTHAEGEYTEASGLDSHAEGYGTVAFGPQSHAEGRNTTASGDQSHAQGQHTEASGRGSHAGGVGTTSSYKVVASGNVSFNHSSNGLPSTAVGATGHYTAILGGRDNSATGQGTAVIGCNGVTGTQDYTTYMDVMKLTELSAQPTSPEVGTITFYADNLWLYNSTGWYQIT